MKKLFESFRKFVNEDIGNIPKSLSHHWITHGCPVGQPQRIGEVLKHTLTENGKIEYYKVKFDDGVEILREDDFIGTRVQQHEHQTRSEDELEDGGCPGSDERDEASLFDLADDPSGHGSATWTNNKGRATISVLDEEWPDSQEF